MGWLSDIGGLIGDIGSWFGEDSPEEQQNKNIDNQRLFAQQGLSWRVADAKNAGLHPLSALGVSTASFSPNPIVVGDGSLGRAGAALGSAADQWFARREAEKVAAKQEVAEAEARERDERVLQREEAESVSRRGMYEAQASRDFAEAQLADSQRMRLQQESVGDKGRMVGNTTPLKQDAVEYKPDLVTSTKSDNAAITAGVHAMFQERTITPGGKKVLVFADSDPAESFEGIGATIVLGVANAIYAGYHGAKAVAEALRMAKVPMNEANRRKAEAAQRAFEKNGINVVKGAGKPSRPPLEWSSY